MAKRYPFSSHNIAVMQAYDASGIKLDQNGVTSGRVKYLRGISITNNEAAEIGLLYIYDSNTEGAMSTPTEQRLTVIIGQSETVVLDFGSPGIKFTTGIIGGMATATGEMPAYGITVWGYEE